MAVDRCVCYRRTFQELAALCTQQGWTTLTELSRETQVGTGCGSCRPYVSVMLRTGATHFAIAKTDTAPQPCAPDPREA